MILNCASIVNSIYESSAQQLSFKWSHTWVSVTGSPSKPHQSSLDSKQYHMKSLKTSFHLNGHKRRFHPLKSLKSLNHLVQYILCHVKTLFNGFIEWSYTRVQPQLNISAIILYWFREKKSAIIHMKMIPRSFCMHRHTTIESIDFNAIEI